ncbi:methionyl-tRNA formyltransferase [Paracoccus sphaerophysae]|uniref:methionyl-tRNA formyltransferase n=1 Tax=Paracoccus sphaerophysae TaxID=690417 RepID=UPI002353D1AA|nr:formyltransferase family protein [Paracoccus sphaerophysae]
MRTVLIGAVEGSAVALRAMMDAGMPPALVVTLPLDRAAAHSDFADLGPLAGAAGARVLRVARSDDPALLAALRELAPDLVMAIGWSQLLGPELRAIPRLGVLGFHPAPLPRMRGRAVIPWQILTGQRQGGATLFWIGEGIDDGPIAAQAVFPIDPDEITARALYDRAVAEMAALLPPLLADLAAGRMPAAVQDHDQATMCARRRPQDGRIDWTAAGTRIERLVRAVGEPYPGATTTLADGTPVRVNRARLHPREGYFVGLPGQVQQVGDGVATVMCGDGACLDLLDWTTEGRITRHAMLGGGDHVPVG